MFTMSRILENKGLILLVALIAVAVVLVPGGAAMAAGRGHSGGHGGHWGGGGHSDWGWYGFGLGVATGALLSYPYYYRPYYPYYSDDSYYPYGYAPATRVIVRERDYTREPEYNGSDWRSSAGDTWYFCRESNAYYPYVRRCAGGWEKVPVVPRSTDPDDDR